MSSDYRLFYNLLYEIMKNDVNKESPIETISVKNDFDGFNYDDEIYENFESPEYTIQKFDTDKIDAFVDNLDYMWFQEYLDELEDEDKNQAQEYVENNYPEFMEDEEWNLFEPMKWNTNSNKEIFDNFGTKHSFDKRNIQWELWDALIESYKNAA